MSVDPGYLAGPYSTASVTTPLTAAPAPPPAPHLSLPLRLAGTHLAVVTSGTAAEIAQSAGVLLATRVGERRSEPAYGSRSDLFTLTGVPQPDTAALGYWEPRATPDVVSVTVVTAPTPGSGVSR